MANKMISDKAKRQYKKMMQKVIKDLSKSVVVHKQPLKTACLNCYFDSLTGKSTGKCKHTEAEAIALQEAWVAAGNSSTNYAYFIKGRCPVCKGVGSLRVARKKRIKCLVNWDYKDNDIVQTQAGKEGVTAILLKTDPKHKDLFNDCTKVVVDGVDCSLSTPPMLRGLGNDTVLFVILFTAGSMPEVTKSEVRKGYYR